MNSFFHVLFPSGILANCLFIYGYFHQSHYLVMGTDARLCVDPATWYSGLRLWIERGNEIDQRDLPVVDHFTTEMDHMSDCVMQNKTPLTPGEEGHGLKIIFAVTNQRKPGTQSSCKSAFSVVSHRINAGGIGSPPRNWPESRRKGS